MPSISRPLVFSCVLTACGIGCTFASLDGFTGGEPQKSAPPGDAAPVPGPPTADVISSPPPISSSDGGADASQPPSGFSCETMMPRPVFCDGFTTAALPAPFDAINTNNGGTVVIDQGALVSTIGAASGSAGACVQKRIQGPYKAIRLELDMNFEQIGGPNAFDFIELSRDSTHEVGLEVTEGGAMRIDQDVVGTSGGAETLVTATNVRFVVNKWIHLRWDVTINGTMATSRINVDGTVVNYTQSADPVATAFDLELGECSISEVDSPWRVRFDNVVLHATP